MNPSPPASSSSASASATLDAFLGRVRESGGWSKRVWIALVIGALLLLLMLPALFGGPAGPRFVGEEVKRGDIDVLVTATGNLAPTTQVDVGSEISGIVSQVFVEVNDTVREGQPIAEIDTARLRDTVARSDASLAANLASVASQRATLSEAQAQLQRLQEVSRLSGGQVPSKSELATQVATVERARASLASAEANVRSAQAQLSSDRTQLAKAVIRSPVSGVVLKRSVDPGQTVQASFNTPSLFLIAEDLKRMKLEVSIDEADVGQVSAGQQASFSVDAYPGREFPARITRVNLGAKNLSGSTSSSSAGGSSVVSYLAMLSLDNDDLILRPGMTATASIRTAGERDAILVPNTALRFSPPAGSSQKKARKFEFRPPRPQSNTNVEQERGIGVGSRQIVHVLEADGSLRVVSVVTGQSNGRFTAVVAPELKPGMRVATALKAVSDE